MMLTIRSRRRTLIVLGAVCWMPGLAAAADDVVADDTARVTGTLVLPAELDSFAGRRLELRLYMMPPRLPMPRQRSIHWPPIAYMPIPLSRACIRGMPAYKPRD